MSRLIARLASSALLVVPVFTHADDATRSAPSAAGPSAAGAASASVADQEFLEYLGSWDGSDEDWVIAGRAVKADANAKGEPAGTGQEQDK